MDSVVSHLRMWGHKSLLEQKRFPTAAQNMMISGPNVYLSLITLFNFTSIVMLNLIMPRNDEIYNFANLYCFAKFASLFLNFESAFSISHWLRKKIYWLYNLRSKSKPNWCLLLKITQFQQVYRIVLLLCEWSDINLLWKRKRLKNLQLFSRCWKTVIKICL